MKKIFILALLFTAVTFTNKAYSQFNIGADIILPIGDGLGDAASLGVGASAGYDYAINDQLKVGGMAGYYILLLKSDFKDQFEDAPSFSLIPLQASLKYALTEQFFLQGLAGFHIVRASSSFQGITVSASETEFSFGAGAGLNLGQIEVSARFQVISDANYIGARVAYNFGGGD